MVKLGTLKSGGIEDAEELEDLGVEARKFLESFSWCKSVDEGFFDRGFADVGVFYFAITLRPGTKFDNTVWVVAGDLSPGYLDTSSCPNGAIALECYVLCMEEWADAVTEGSSTEGMMPALARNSLRPVEHTEEMAKAVKSRMNFIRRELLSQWKDELD